MKAPIALFTYARPDHTRRTVEALLRNKHVEESHLFVFCDGPRKNADQETLDRIDETRQLVRKIDGFGQITLVEREQNLGLDRSVLKGIEEVFAQYDRIIVLEDDIEVSPGFLTFMNDALELYQGDEEVMHISGYLYPVQNAKELPTTFFLSMGGNWGWATWKDSWKRYDDDIEGILERLHADEERMRTFNLGGSAPMLKQLMHNKAGRFYTWDIYWHAALVLNQGLALFPHHSLTRNIGHDGTGEHGEHSSVYAWENLAETIEVVRIPKEVNTLAREKVKDFFDMQLEKGKPNGIIEKIKTWFK